MNVIVLCVQVIHLLQKRMSFCTETKSLSKPILGWPAHCLGEVHQYIQLSIGLRIYLWLINLVYSKPV